MADQTGTVTIAGGKGTWTFRPPYPHTYVIRQISVEIIGTGGAGVYEAGGGVGVAAGSGSTCVVRKNGWYVGRFDVPTADTMREPPPITVEPGDVLTVTWTGFTDGQVGRVFMIYDDQDELLGTG